ncbi:ornithine racemase Orr [uncultured Clostridium sp.]|uniref:ornithine racemase Orr n=1 Tax=uncultured Clostridium sp. TaxID=59620 RepID=UPI00321775B2
MENRYPGIEFNKENLTYNAQLEQDLWKEEVKDRYPRIDIDLKKLTYNAKFLLNMCNGKMIDVAVVTKVFCSEPDIVKGILDAGVKTIGDSRIANLKKIVNLPCEKLLLRIPALSEVREVIMYSDISLNSEIDTIKALSKEAIRAKKTHKIILMIDLGDLREGVLEKDVLEISREIVKLSNIKFMGIGTNLTCYGGVIPDEVNLGRLLKLKNNIEEELNIKIPIVSGGNSSSLYMVMNKTIPEGINSLRLGESVVLGRETAYGRDIPGMFRDVFTLKGEIIEIKDKPSVPIGNIGMDAFGEVPTFQDRGIIKRAIISMGRQDVKIDGITPRDEKIRILGGSSDHLLLDVTESESDYKVGDIISFDVDYGALLSLMTSSYINKCIM